jgi:hypothetical protein
LAIDKIVEGFGAGNAFTRKEYPNDESLAFFMVSYSSF